jgi:hypothetical protein
VELIVGRLKVGVLLRWALILGRGHLALILTSYRGACPARTGAGGLYRLQHRVVDLRSYG